MFINHTGYSETTNVKNYAISDNAGQCVINHTGYSETTNVKNYAISDNAGQCVINHTGYSETTSVKNYAIIYLITHVNVSLITLVIQRQPT